MSFTEAFSAAPAKERKDGVVASAKALSRSKKSAAVRETPKPGNQK